MNILIGISVCFLLIAGGVALLAIARNVARG